MMHGKAIWKPGEIGKVSKGITPEPHSKGRGGGYSTPYKPPAAYTLGYGLWP